jgi:hypothetical protein
MLASTFFGLSQLAELEELGVFSVGYAVVLKSSRGGRRRDVSIVVMR